MPPPELAEQGVYCDGCHTIEAEWQRPKKEVTPPQSSVEAGWKVKDFGGDRSDSAPGGNGASATAPANPSAIDLRKANQQSSAAKKIASRNPARRPFGRGPKGKRGGR